MLNYQKTNNELQNSINWQQYPTNKSHQCSNCGMVFNKLVELHNHVKKFCVNSGFDTLAGLNIKVHDPFFAKKVKDRKLNDSLTDALEQAKKRNQFVPYKQQLVEDIQNYKRHQEQMGYARKYIHRPRSRETQSTPRTQKSHSLSFQDVSDVSYRNERKTLDRKYLNRNRSNISQSTDLYKSNIKNLDSSYMSPPTQLPTKLPLMENAKKISILDKSDISIKNMHASERKQYVIRKLLELEGILDSFRKNGGNDITFQRNIRKMIEFYKNLKAQIDQKNYQQFGKLQESSRPSTPISKLQKLKQSNVLNESLVCNFSKNSTNSKFSDAYKMSLFKKQQKTRKKLNNQISDDYIRRSQFEQQINKRFNKNNENENKNVIVIPVNQPQNNNGRSEIQELNLRHIEQLMKVKAHQNQKLMQIINKMNKQQKQRYEQQLKKKEKIEENNQKKINNLEKRMKKLLLQNKFQNKHPISPANTQLGRKQFRSSHPRRHRTEYGYGDDLIPEYRAQSFGSDQDIRNLNLQKDGFYSGSKNDISYEQKILLQMQQQERDELQLFSHLPKQLQQIKLQSIRQMTEKRHQMEQQVLKQKIQKLKHQQNISGFQLERILENQDIENEQRKLSIRKMMKKKVKQFAKQEFQDALSSSSSDEQKEQKKPLSIPSKLEPPKVQKNNLGKLSPQLSSGSSYTQSDSDDYSKDSR